MRSNVEMCSNVQVGALALALALTRLVNLNSVSMSEQLTALLPLFIFRADDKHEYKPNRVRYNFLSTYIVSRSACSLTSTSLILLSKYLTLRTV